MKTIRAVYHVACRAADAERVARDIAIEQTVESPESLISTEIEERVVGRVASILPLGDGRFALTLDYSADPANGQLPQLLNLVYGNISLKRSIRLVDLTLPDGIVARFRGPKLGVEGLRALVGVFGRPLLGAVLKPRGMAAEALAALAGEFARGGGDLVKDDHNLVDASLDEFRRRVGLCQAAVDAANSRTGRNCLYVCNLSVPAGELARYVESALALGVRGFLVAPLVLGLDTVRHLSESYPVLLLAHPTFAGTFFHDRSHGIEPGLLLGTLFRLAGADISIVPVAGGRLSLTWEECASVAGRLQAPLGTLRPSLPAPAGGLELESIPAVLPRYGADALFLVGGALLSHGPNLRDSVAAFLETIRRHSAESLAEPRPDLVP